ncbi:MULTISPECIES: hypothetical protein [unclassified Variovorax]|uniref:hypothetical protein n=1 Tax=unclassified Variovorax TaxID=663243 RepID=UPI003F514271
MTAQATLHDFTTYGAGSVPKQALVHWAVPVTVFSTQRVSAPSLTRVGLETVKLCPATISAGFGTQWTGRERRRSPHESSYAACSAAAA